jgi:VanZ family protein
MTNGTGSAYRFNAALRWGAWFVFIAGWSLALLTPQPVELADTVLGEPAAFWSAKVLHVSAYAVLVTLTASLPVAWPARLLLLACLSAHAIGTEYFQQFVRLRTPSWRDAALDHLGILIGLVITCKFWFACNRWKVKQDAQLEESTRRA